MQSEWNDKVFSVTPAGFERLALEIFHFQYHHNSIYRQYTDAIKVNPKQVNTLAQIPFLPIRFFKSHPVQTTAFETPVVFESSGTTGTINSRHFVKDISIYEESFLRGFDRFYGSPKDWCIIALLPSYLERQNSSLVYMVNELIGKSNHPDSGFYLHEHEKLATVLKKLEVNRQKTLLIGVTFGLLDFSEKFHFPLQHTIIMETGGMKGRRKEMIRQQVHTILKEAFSVEAIHSEYGMTELLSQAYSTGDGIFQCPGWMKVIVRDEEDPLHIKLPDAENSDVLSGAVNVIDLANIYSCSFIATEDAGKIYPDNSFEILGRMDNSDLRGCSLLVV